jgi:predicted dehydrogenase
MPNDKLRVGIIGIGLYALMDHVPNFRKTGRAEIVAISRRNPQKLALAKEALGVNEAYTDWREMLDRSRLDAVVVSTPHNAHTEPTLAALQRGLHVLLEKPMCLTSKDAWAMVDAAERASRVLMVGYPNRCLGLWRTVRRTLEEGSIGQVRQVNLAFSSYRRWFWEAEALPEELQGLAEKLTGMPAEFFDDWLNWHRNPAEMGGGMFADIGTHVADLMLWLAGAPPTEVVAFSESAGLSVECFLNIQARLANGVLLSMTSADVVSKDLVGSQQRLVIVGELGMLIDDPEGGVWISRDGARRRVEAEIPDTTKADAFVSAVTEGGENLGPARDGAYAVALTEAAYRSAAEWRIVRVDLH